MKESASAATRAKPKLRYASIVKNGLVGTAAWWHRHLLRLEQRRVRKVPRLRPRGNPSRQPRQRSQRYHRLRRSEADCADVGKGPGMAAVMPSCRWRLTGLLSAPPSRR